MCPPSAVCPFKHRFRLFTPHDLWHSSIGIGAKSFGWLVWRRNLSSSTIGTPGALRQANLWSFMCLSKSCCFSWQNSFWNSKGWAARIFALRPTSYHIKTSCVQRFESKGLFPTFLWFGMGDTKLSSSIMGYWQKHEIQVEVIPQQSKRQTRTKKLCTLRCWRNHFIWHGTFSNSSFWINLQTGVWLIPP